MEQIIIFHPLNMVDAIIRFVSIDKPITIPVGVEAVWFPEFGLGDLRCRCGWWVGKLGDRSLFYSEEHETDQPADHPWRSGTCSCCFRRMWQACTPHARSLWARLVHPWSLVVASSLKSEAFSEGHRLSAHDGQAAGRSSCYGEPSELPAQSSWQA